MSIEKDHKTSHGHSNDKLVNLARSIGELAATADVFARHQLLPAVQSAVFSMDPLATNTYKVSPSFGDTTAPLIKQRLKDSKLPEGVQIVSPTDARFPNDKIPPPHVVVYLLKSNVIQAREKFPDALDYIYLDHNHVNDFKL